VPSAVILRPGLVECGQIFYLALIVSSLHLLLATCAEDVMGQRVGRVTCEPCDVHRYGVGEGHDGVVEGLWIV